MQFNPDMLSAASSQMLDDVQIDDIEMPFIDDPMLFDEPDCEDWAYGEHVNGLFGLGEQDMDELLFQDGKRHYFRRIQS